MGSANVGTGAEGVREERIIMSGQGRGIFGPGQECVVVFSEWVRTTVTDDIWRHHHRRCDKPWAVNERR